MFFLFCLQMAAGPGLPCTAGRREATEKQENGLPPSEDKNASHQPWVSLEVDQSFSLICSTLFGFCVCVCVRIGANHTFDVEVVC